MKILGIDTSTRCGSVGLIDEEKVIFEYLLNMPVTHSERLLEAINYLLKEARCPMELLDGRAISLGPGSFTGLRIGVSTVKGLAYVTQIPVAGVSSLDVLASQTSPTQCGIESKVPAVPSIALGSADISLVEMVRAYTMFPGRGFNVKPYFITRIVDRNGNVLASFTTKGEEVISEADAYVMTKMMQGVVDFGTGRALRSAYGITAEMAGKTGTTNDNADGWFIGFTPQLLAGVWVGADDPFLRLLYTTGGAQMAMPAYAYFFQEVYRDKTLIIDPAAKVLVPKY